MFIVRLKPLLIHIYCANDILHKSKYANNPKCDQQLNSQNNEDFSDKEAADIFVIESPSVETNCISIEFITTTRMLLNLYCT